MSALTGRASPFLSRRMHAVMRMSVSCSSSQPSKRRSQRLKQQPRPTLNREEALRQLQQRTETEADTAPATQTIELEGTDVEAPAAALHNRPGAAAAGTQPSQPAPLLNPHPEAAALNLLRAKPRPADLPQVSDAGHAAMPAPTAGAAAQSTAAEAAASMAGAQQGGREVVEADEIWDPLLEELIAEQAQAPTDRKGDALRDILDAGEQIEERILQHRDEIDEDMLALLSKRVELAEALQQDDAVRGLQLLYRRLKAEVDRKAATPAMRLLDDLINILDPNLDGPASAGPAAAAGGAAANGSFSTARDGGSAEAPPGTTGGGVASLLAEQEARRGRALARMQAAFGLGLPQDADVMSLAAQLAQGGEQLADGLFGEAVEPEAFLTEVTQLLDQAAAQREEVEAYLAQLGPGQEAHAAEVEAALEQRDQAMGLVQQVQELVAGFRHRQKQEQLREWQQ